MTEPSGQSEPNFRLSFWPTLKVRQDNGADVSPTARKGRALLALLALSDEKSVTRARAAAMLWSSLERTDALARLRNMLHQLQQVSRKTGVELFRVEDAAIHLRTDLVAVESEPMNEPEAGTGPDLLAELEGIDPAFDRWLTHVHSKWSPNRVRQTADPHQPGSRGRLGIGPSIAVTEFDGVGAAADTQFARALTEEVGDALVRIRWFTTITRSTRGQRLSAGNEDLSQIADYLLVGTVQAEGTHRRLLLKLMDLNHSGAIVWGAALEENGEDERAAQRNLAACVAARLDTELLYIEADRRKHAPPSEKPDAYALVLAAVLAIYRLEREPFLGAGHALEEAIAADRDSALAHSWLAYWHMFLIGQGWASNPFQSMAQAGKAADRAILLDPKDARAVTIAGHVKAFLSRKLDAAATLHELAIQINPTLPLAWHLYGVTHAYFGRLDDAFRAISRSLQLAPNDPHGFFAEGALGIVHLLRGEYEAAANIGRRVTERHPQFISAYKSYLAALGHLGRSVEAAGVRDRLMALEPRFSLQRFRAGAQYQRAEDLERFMTGLRLAGVT